MKIHDVSALISEELSVYPGDPPVSIREVADMEQGAVYNSSLLCFGSHTGTHIDVPKHFINNGVTCDSVSLDHFMGEAKVIDLSAIFDKTGRNVLEVEDVMGYQMDPGDIILFKTTTQDQSKDRELCHNSSLSLQLSEYLVGKKIKTVGIDSLSVSAYGEEKKGHLIFFLNNICIIEGLVLDQIKEGTYELIALPLKLKNGNGSPVRAVLIEH